jgi:hypothetical protein
MPSETEWPFRGLQSIVTGRPARTVPLSPQRDTLTTVEQLASNRWICMRFVKKTSTSSSIRNRFDVAWFPCSFRLHRMFITSVWKWIVSQFVSYRLCINCKDWLWVLKKRRIIFKPLVRNLSSSGCRSVGIIRLRAKGHGVLSPPFARVLARTTKTFRYVKICWNANRGHSSLLRSRLNYDRRSVDQSFFFSGSLLGSITRFLLFFSWSEIFSILSGAPLLMRGRVCSVHCTESLVLISQDQLAYFVVSQETPSYTPATGFPFCRLSWFTGLRWRYSDPPPHGWQQLFKPINIQCVPHRKRITSQLQSPAG